MTSSDGEMTRVSPGVLPRFPGERPSLAVGKDWMREARINLKPEWRALIDGAEVKELIKHRDAALHQTLVLSAADVTGNTVITQAMVYTRDKENAIIAEANVSRKAQREVNGW